MTKSLINVKSFCSKGLRCSTVPLQMFHFSKVTYIRRFFVKYQDKVVQFPFNLRTITERWWSMKKVLLLMSCDENAMLFFFFFFFFFFLYKFFFFFIFFVELEGRGLLTIRSLRERDCNSNMVWRKYLY